MNTESQIPKRASGWSAIRQQIADWSKPALLALVKDMHDASAENRDFLRARFDAENSGGEPLEKYRRKIIEQFFPQRGDGNEGGTGLACRAVLSRRNQMKAEVGRRRGICCGWDYKDFAQSFRMAGFRSV